MQHKSTRHTTTTPHHEGHADTPTTQSPYATALFCYDSFLFSSFVFVAVISLVSVCPVVWGRSTAVTTSGSDTSNSTRRRQRHQTRGRYKHNQTRWMTLLRVTYPACVCVYWWMESPHWATRDGHHETNSTQKDETKEHKQEKERRERKTHERVRIYRIRQLDRL